MGEWIDLSYDNYIFDFKENGELNITKLYNQSFLRKYEFILNKGFILLSQDHIPVDTFEIVEFSDEKLSLYLKSLEIKFDFIRCNTTFNENSINSFLENSSIKLTIQSSDDKVLSLSYFKHDDFNKRVLNFR
jgi:hypothetical protein